MNGSKESGGDDSPSDGFQTSSLRQASEANNQGSCTSSVSETKNVEEAWRDEEITDGQVDGLREKVCTDSRPKEFKKLMGVIVRSFKGKKGLRFGV